MYANGCIVAVSGVVKADRYYGMILTSPEIQLIDLDQVRDTKNSILPIYPLTKGVNNEIVQDAVSSALEMTELLIDPLPQHLRRKCGLMELQVAIANIHQPPDVLEKSTDGFFISEMDLRLRGPGVVMGYRQSGISEFALANILDDEDLLNLAREMAVGIVKSDPYLEAYPLMVAELKRLGLTSWNCALN